MSLISSGVGATTARVARWLLAAAACCCATAQAQFLDAPTQQKIRAATFEVVMLKPDEPNVSYEKPLPLDLLPYQFRNDKYFPAGTAFAIGEHRFVTAAHVLGLGIVSLWGTPAVRDSSGKVYQIDKVLKYSTAQDFAVFSVVDEPAVQPLDIGPHPALNEAVYAVGNALGEGVVIRDGLYTSDTPEERDGKWKWLRFSAAASPGNSGGPLLDKDGKVIGVVLRKSPNENLNYALSIDDLLAGKDNTAVIDGRMSYQLDVFNYKQTEIIHQEFALPKSYADFSRSYLDYWYPFEDQLLQHLLKNNADKTFPRGQGSSELLHIVQAGEAPGLVIEGQDGNWSVHRPVQGGRTELGHNGYVTAGRQGNLLLGHLRRPDDVPAPQFYGDSRLYMDSLLRGQAVYRSVGSENVRIISLGKAQEDSVFVDSWQRKWQLREWPVPFQNYVAISLALPVPDGYIVMVRSVAPAQVHEHVNDLKAIADFVDVSYIGTLVQWQEFRKIAALQPAALEPVQLQFDYGKGLRYDSPRLSFNYAPTLQKITADSKLYLDFSYFDDHGKVVWDVARVKINEDAQNQSFVSVARNIEPTSVMSDDFKSRWSKLAHHQHPYDAVVVNDGDLSAIHSVHQPAAAATDDEGVLYTVMVQNEGVATQETMQTKLDQLMQGLSIKDDRTPKGGGGAESQD
jgi:serine protease Do